MSNNTPDYEDNLAFEPQNTKKDLCITSEQLTEQWKKGELLEGFYYVKVKEVIANYPLLADCVEGLSYTYFLDYEDYVTEVLAPVPSYDEWEKLNWYAGNGVEENQELKMENAQLKELLKEWVQFETEENPNDFTVMSERMSELANKTKEVLK